jgi:FKBP-type peptidyl-prolyl cis-trans isomerase FkpA
MKAKITMMVAAVLALVLTACNADYKKTKSGLVYKIFPGDSKDSAVKKDNVVKFHFIRKINDSLLYSSYGKMAAYQPWTDDPGMNYSPLEVLFMMKEGDSAITIELADTLLQKGMQQQMPFAKKGDQIKTFLKVIKIYRTDSLARVDYAADLEKDKPRQEAEMKEMQAKQMEEIKKQKDKELAELKSSGELARQEKEVEAYIAKKNATAVKAPGGTYVQIKQKGTGEPVVAGKVVTIKYAGRLVVNDSLFEANQYIFTLGAGEAIGGWDDGLTLFNKGGVGVLYIPAYLAYGKQEMSGRTNASLVFDVEVMNISNTKEEAYAAKAAADSLSAVKKTVK